MNYDKKFLSTRQKKVLNKNARHNICFADFDQEPNYEIGKGRVMDFVHVPMLNEIRKFLPKLFGEKANELYAESNCYYDLRSTYIGFHGDRERNIVIGIRLGAKFELYFRWYFNNELLGEMIPVHLNSGDGYLMAEGAVGYNWLEKKRYVLRHGAWSDEKLKKTLRRTITKQKPKMKPIKLQK